MYWTKSNFPAKCDFKSDEDKNKHSLDACEGTVKFRHTLLIYFGYPSNSINEYIGNKLKY